MNGIPSRALDGLNLQPYYKGIFKILTIFQFYRIVLTVFLVSDSYIGLDQLYEVRLNVVQPPQDYIAKMQDIQQEETGMDDDW